ncbi:hypothetical protein GP486_003229 [Trichoglossum hirsutum]|uniref:Uncharacterized protein n=1 Tax=Trichoglossum hirsutum TaxID=265104 RepID=A0A9P8RRD1_9PEZI|nr:hypothetical protein GP486_003229 [Trichoglossum hirsutum]
MAVRRIERLFVGQYRNLSGTSRVTEMMEDIQPSGFPEPGEHAGHKQQQADIVRRELEQSYDDISQRMVVPLIQTIKDEFAALIPHLIQQKLEEPGFKANEQIAELQEKVLSLEKEKRKAEQQAHWFEQELDQADCHGCGQEELERLEEENKTLKIEMEILKKGRRDDNAKIKNLHQMLIRAGHRDEAPMDDEVRAGFLNLKYKILQLVKNHFSKFPEHNARLSPDASPDYQELLARSAVARTLYEKFFSPGSLSFGVGGNMEELLKEFERALQNSTSIKAEDAIEWRARTAQAAKALNLPGWSSRVHNIAKDVTRDFVQYYSQSRYAVKENSRAFRDVEEICEMASDLALMFRCNKIEYLWEQMPTEPTPPNVNDIELLGTDGPDLSQPHRIVRIVFGGVVRGDRETGRLKDGKTRISKSGVLIGSR